MDERASGGPSFWFSVTHVENLDQILTFWLLCGLVLDVVGIRSVAADENLVYLPLQKQKHK